MRELSLNILDISQNSIKADSSNVEILIEADLRSDALTVSIKDDGKGMSKEFLESVTDPFTTTRTTRKVGMGLPLFKMAAESTGGTFKIESEPGKGTVVKAVFVISSIDRMPLGDIADTMAALMQGAPDIDYKLIYRLIKKEPAETQEYVFDTVEVRSIFEGIPLDDYEIVCSLKEHIKENINAINGGLDL